MWSACAILAGANSQILLNIETHCEHKSMNCNMLADLIDHISSSLLDFSEALAPGRLQAFIQLRFRRSDCSRHILGTVV